MPTTENPIGNQLIVKGVADWSAWVGRFAAFVRVGKSALVVMALAKLARDMGFPEPMPERRGTQPAPAPKKTRKNPG